MGERLRASGRTESTGQPGPLLRPLIPLAIYPKTEPAAPAPAGSTCSRTRLQGQRSLGEEGPGGVPGQAGSSAGRG